MKYNELNKQIKNYLINNYSQLFILSELSEDYIYYCSNSGFFRIKIIEIYLLEMTDIMEIDIMYNEKIEKYLISKLFKYKIVEDDNYKGINMKIEFKFITNLNFLFEFIDYIFPILKTTQMSF